MNLSNFSERLKEMIVEAGKDATTVGQEIGCGNATVSHYLTGRHLPTLEMAIVLADYFNCSLDYLLGFTDYNQSADYKPCPPFSERLSYICKKCNISRYKIGKLTGIAESVMRYWAQGKTKPSIYNVALIAEVLDVSIDFVVGRES